MVLELRLELTWKDMRIPAVVRRPGDKMKQGGGL